MNEQTLIKERSFCIELRSRDCIKSVSMTKSPEESVLIEGVLGKLIGEALRSGPSPILRHLLLIVSNNFSP